MFDELIESSHSPEKRRSRTVFLSLLVHAVVLAVILVIPLIYYQGAPQVRAADRSGGGAKPGAATRAAVSSGPTSAAARQSSDRETGPAPVHGAHRDP